MKQTSDAITIAEAVLYKASEIDYRLKLPDTAEAIDRKVQAWASVFNSSGENGAGTVVWLFEALAAVDSHYSKSNAFPIMPGDVVDKATKPIFTSSRERMTAWLLEWMTKYPLSNFVQTVLDIEWYPESRERAEASIESRNWLLERLDSVVDQFMAMGWEAAHAKGLGAPLPPSVDPFGVTRALGQ